MRRPQAPPAPSKPAARSQEDPDRARSAQTRKPAAVPTRRAVGAGGAPRTPAPKFFTLAPPEFKSHFIKVKLSTGDDGLVSRIDCTRIDGRWNNVEPRRNTPLQDFDIPTQNALISRLSGKFFAPNPAKRLRPNTGYMIWIRVGPRSAREKEVEEGLLNEGDVVVAARVYSIQRWTRNRKTQKMEGEFLNAETHKDDLDRRRIRSAGAHLHGAFANAVLPPKRVRGKVVGMEED